MPRVIVNDHGVDIAGGVALFQQRHPATVDIYDIKHKAACLLKHRLEKNPRWQEFQREISLTRCAIQQTALGFLTPPSLKNKARFMNLEDQLNWAGHVLRILRNPSPVALQNVSVAFLREKLGWLEAYRAEAGEWAEWQDVVNTAVVFVNQQGVYAGAADDLKRNAPACYQHPTSEKLATELETFVRAESAKARAGERLPGSTEILESCFGKFKVLEREQSRGGFTGLLLAFGALLMTITQRNITAALQQSRTQFVYNWFREHLGRTPSSQRKLAYDASAIQTG